MGISVIPLVVPIAVVPEPPAATGAGNARGQRAVKPLAEGQKGKPAGRRTGDEEDKDPNLGRKVDTSA